VVHWHQYVFSQAFNLYSFFYSVVSKQLSRYYGTEIKAIFLGCLLHEKVKPEEAGWILRVFFQNDFSFKKPFHCYIIYLISENQTV